MDCIDQEEYLEPVVTVSNHHHRLTVWKSSSWNCNGRYLPDGCVGIQSGMRLDGYAIRYRCNDCDFDYCISCLSKYKTDDVTADSLDTVYLRPKGTHVKVRRIPTFESSDCGLVLCDKSYKFEKVVGDWAKLSPCEYERLRACTDLGTDGQPLFQEHNPVEDGWCPLIKEGDVLFEAALLNKLGLPMYRGIDGYYCGRKLGKDYVGYDTNGSAMNTILKPPISFL